MVKRFCKAADKCPICVLNTQGGCRHKKPHEHGVDCFISCGQPFKDARCVPVEVA